MFRKWSSRSKSSSSENKSEVAVLSLPGLTSSDKAINDLGKEIKSVPLSPSLLLLSQTKNILPEAAWYYNYLDSVSGELPYLCRFAWKLHVCLFPYRNPMEGDLLDNPYNI